MVSALTFVSLAFARPELARPGELLGGLQVTEVVEHPEFVRVSVALPDGRVLPLEVTAAEAGTGICHHHGLSVFPRWELLGEAVVVGDQPAAVAELCRRVEELGAGVALQPPGATRDVAAEAESPPRPLSEDTLLRPADMPPHSTGLLAGVLGGLLVGALAGVLQVVLLRRPSRRDLAELGLVALLGAGLRLWLSPRVVYWGPAFGYSRLVEAWGSNDPHPFYGGAFAVLMGPISRATGFSPDAVHFGNLGLAMLAPPLLWGIGRLLAGPGGPAPLVAGLGLALLPSHLRLAGSEVMHVSVLSFELLAVLAAVAATREEGRVAALLHAVVSALATAFVAHVRPEALVFAVVPAAWVLVHARARLYLPIAVAAGIIVPLVGLRAIELGGQPGSGAVNLALLVQADFWSSALLPRVGTPGANSATNTFLHLRLTPPLLPLLALLGLFHPCRAAVALAVLWVAFTGPVALLKSWPLADALRLQLPLQAPLLLLAGLGADVAVRRWRWPPWSLPAALGVLALPYLPGVARLWAPHQEYLWLREQLPKLPEGATVLYDDAGPHAEGFARWCQDQGPAGRWVGVDRWFDAEEPVSNLFFYRGVSCFLEGAPGREAPPSACQRVVERCRLRPFAETQVGTATDVDAALAQAPTIGFYVVDGCAP